MSKIFKTPEEAEAAFYDAIEKADVVALDAVWSKDENIVCIHPGATRIAGRQAVLDSFVDLFSDAPILSFCIMDSLHTGNEHMAIHHVRERIQIDGQMLSIMVATNIYHMESGGWRLLVHHASPEPDLSYQPDFDEYESMDFDDMDDELDELDDMEERSRPPVLH